MVAAAYRPCNITVIYRTVVFKSTHAADNTCTTYRVSVIAVFNNSVSPSAHAADIGGAAEIRINNAYIGYFAVYFSISEETYITSL